MDVVASAAIALSLTIATTMGSASTPACQTALTRNAALMAVAHSAASVRVVTPALTPGSVFRASRNATARSAVPTDAAVLAAYVPTDSGAIQQRASAFHPVMCAWALSATWMALRLGSWMAGPSMVTPT
jgi:hypothetical protein